MRRGSPGRGEGCCGVAGLGETEAGKRSAEPFRTRWLCPPLALRRADGQRAAVASGGRREGGSPQKEIPGATAGTALPAHGERVAVVRMALGWSCDKVLGGGGGGGDGGSGRG